MDDICSGGVLLNHGSSLSKDNQIWMCNRRFGHAFFGYIKHLFLTIFSNCNLTDFQYDVCILAKNHRASYSLSSNKMTEPFALIHLDVWDPTLISMLSGYC